jgi:3-hydroxy-9,10-secoandrosta-1,3,5(10)-triene-9,17-dione monooxygenase reductase component
MPDESGVRTSFSVSGSISGSGSDIAQNGSTSASDRLEELAMTDEQKHSIGKAIGKLPSGVYILTVVQAEQSAAMMVSWLQQAAFAPPAITIAMARERPARRLIEAGGKLAISVLPKGDKTLMKKYARGIPEGQDPFEGVATARAPGGAVYLSDALAYLECRLMKTLEYGADHDLYVAEVTAGELLSEDSPFTHVRGNGFHY